jgi:CubicO group peptidase (beta-lactamase class C family)
MPRKPLTFSLCFVYISLAILYVLNPVRLIAPPPAGDLSAFTRELDVRIPRAMRESHVPGVSIALIQRGQVVWIKGYGLADVQTREPVTAQTVFQAASISKTVTAWGVMKLVEEGTLDLDAPAETYLRRWHLPPSSFDSNEVTVRRLLSHNSGIAGADYLGYPPGQPLPSLEESLTNGPPALIGRMKDFPGTRDSGRVRLVAPPGQVFRYSDANFVLLQLIIEEVTGEPFAAYMQREVLSPLGMTDSSFARTPGLIARTAIPYDAHEKPLPDYAFTELAPAGLYTTVSDLARFVASAFPSPDGEPAGRGVVSPDTINLMTSPAVPIPGFDSWVYADSYGFGYFIDILPDGERLLSHSGGNLGWACEFAAFPSTGDGVVIMTNSSIGHDFFASVLTTWTDWLGRDETHIAHAILLSHRVFQTLSFSMLAAAAILFIHLVIGIRSGVRRLAHLPINRAMGAALCVFVLVVYWMAGHSWMQVNIPSQDLGMLWGVNLLCLALFSNALFVQNP